MGLRNSYESYIETITKSRAGWHLERKLLAKHHVDDISEELSRRAKHGGDVGQSAHVRNTTCPRVAGAEARSRLLERTCAPAGVTPLAPA